MGARITAIGTINGKALTVCCCEAEGEIQTTYNGTVDPIYDRRFRAELAAEHPIAGTYFPGVNTMHNALGVLCEHFFDTVPKISIEGEIEEIPFDEGVIY